MSIETKTQYLAELEQKLHEASVDQAILVAKGELGLASELFRLSEGVDAFAYSDPTRKAYTSPNAYGPGQGGRPDDYLDGKCWPLYETEQDLQELRGIGRWFAAWDEMGRSILTNLRNYTIGDGFVTECTPRDKSPEAKALAAEVQAFCDEFDDVNDWQDEGETDAFTAGIVDGDHLLRLRQRGAAAPRVQFVGGEHITEPNNPAELEDYYGLPSCCWRFGVATRPGDTSLVRGYFLDWFGKGTDWEFVPAEEAVFIKRNTPKQAKRGVSDFAVPWRSLEKGAKLFDRTVGGATAQASIGYIKKALQGTPQSALDARLGASGLTSPTSVRRPNGGLASATAETIDGVKVITTTGDYVAGPMGTLNGPVFMDILQGVGRRVGSNWCMPEYMVTGDASNANYSSTLVAESPFVQNTKQEQGNHARRSRELRWKSVDMAARHGRFGGMRAADIRRLVKIDVVGPPPESRDPVQQEAVRDRQQAAGILSRRTRAAQTGLDFDEELANGAKEAAQPATAPQAMAESRIRDIRFSLLEGE